MKTKTYYKNNQYKWVDIKFRKAQRTPLNKVVKEQLKKGHINENDVKFFKQLVLTARQVATKEFLPLKDVKSWKVRCNSNYGWCNHYGDIRINITFDRHYTNILNTLSHELAHLKFMHHYKDFWNYHNKLLPIVVKTFNKIGDQSISS